MANDSISNTPIQIPKWDVALEALVKEEHQKLARPLYLDDFQRLAKQYTIRLDDIMVTLFELCIHGMWQYRGSDGKPKEITRELLDEMTAGGRLKDEDLRNFPGGWIPLS
jgi:hypothetical protein